MPTLTRSGLTRRVRDLLNSNGLHWVKGEFEDEKYIDEKDKYVTGWCLAGGFRQVLTGSGSRLPYEDDERTLYNDGLKTLAEVIRRRFPERVPHLSPLSSPETIVIDFNDHDDTTWEDVNSVLTEAALDKAKQATPPSA